MITEVEANVVMDYGIYFDWCDEYVEHRQYFWMIGSKTGKPIFYFYDATDATAFKIKFGL